MIYSVQGTWRYSVGLFIATCLSKFFAFLASFFSVDDDYKSLDLCVHIYSLHVNHTDPFWESKEQDFSYGIL